jgi:TonB-dependent SusC/RagA subfamily outer membrane receptor
MMTSWMQYSEWSSLRKKIVLSLTTLALVLVTGQWAMAQNTVTGTVTDATTGETIPGVNVVIQGTTTGTFTDIDGLFELEVPSLEDVLEFSFVGYQTLIEPINGRTEINVQLQMGVLAGEELVVVGYGVQTRETISGSVSSIDGPRMEQVPVTNLANSLTGNLPGIVTVNQSGEPGNDGAVIRIRGESTLNNNQPLIVIDGVPDRAGGLDRLNPRDIESVSILKDASAAIYGSRAANGVILITTKRGQAGAPRFSIDMNQGFNQPTRVPEMADAKTYMTMLNELDSYRGLNERYSDAEIQCHAQQQDAWNCPDIDLESERDNNIYKHIDLYIQTEKDRQWNKQTPKQTYMQRE